MEAIWNGGEFWNMGEFWNGGEFGMWANFNSPLRHTQTPSYQAHDVFFCIYMHICERPDNTRVGANCN